MTAPDKMECNWILDAGTVQALSITRLWLPPDLTYADILRMSTTMLFEEIDRVCMKEGVGVNEAIHLMFERYSKTSVPIEIKVNFTPGPGRNGKQTDSEKNKGDKSQ